MLQSTWAATGLADLVVGTADIRLLRPPRWRLAAIQAPEPCHHQFSDPDVRLVDTTGKGCPIMPYP
jgi:hypothetical protein